MNGWIKIIAIGLTVAGIVYAAGGTMYNLDWRVEALETSQKETSKLVRNHLGQISTINAQMENVRTNITLMRQAVQDINKRLNFEEIKRLNEDRKKR